ncbi:phytoene/squalene synthase family protein [Salisediminibacterium halotolerans]|uniref:phytoene/squalene synthase family protein n=1 Tax=Salisediminibacterium halotolerans TaxID=517425 RepID=UPI000F1E0F42|nr:phytoene/squalene synthase family protein [Salisediminibacterium halotolerans]RLJ78021.1 phytoene synthase [Actinophytocola xinjiangensis]RPE88641.1 phytoene synthase [Salisediminibacterium halotolerans]TWG36998.1 phytoene synthase [Salisediminibacterium halotolerans]GEL08792.1 phytoene synthase [Salisediminibacterium halotolerans]
MNINEAYAQCKEIIDHHSKTFSRAFQHLPQMKRRGVWAVYAFCRTADDIVDEGENAEEELAFFREQLTRFKKGERPANTALWIALEDTFTRFDFSFQPFFDMLDGQHMDLTKTRYHTIEEVFYYSYHVAGTVGLMLLPILAPGREKELYNSAVHLGYAMQITNILRDIGEDAGRGRIYIPEERMSKHGYSEEQLQQGLVNQSFINLWEEMAREAEQEYEKGLAYIENYPRNARIPVKAAALFYREILQVVRKENYNVFQRRVFVSVEEKQQLFHSLIET